mgnify:CR=1 FL=1
MAESIATLRCPLMAVHSCASVRFVPGAEIIYAQCILRETGHSGLHSAKLFPVFRPEHKAFRYSWLVCLNRDI